MHETYTPTPNVSTGAAVGATGLMRIASPGQVTEAEKAAARAEEEQQTPVIETLASYIHECFDTNQKFRRNTGIEDAMIEALEQRNGTYSTAKLADIREQGGSEVFLTLTEVKCRHAEAWCMDILAPTIDKPWKLAPTPDPELPPGTEEAIVERSLAEWRQRLSTGGMLPQEVYELASRLRDDIDDEMQREATRRAENMDRKIYDQMAEGGWQAAFEDFVTDLVTYPCAIMKGPIVRNRPKKRWVRNKQGKLVRKIRTELTPEYERVSPYDLYPSPGSTTVEDAVNLIERQEYSRSQLLDMKGNEGYDDDAIDLVLLEYGVQGFHHNTEVDEARSDEEDTGERQHERQDWIEALEFWGSAQGGLLIDKGMTEDPDGNPIEPLAEYEINAIVVNNRVIYLRFNDDEAKECVYSKTVYAKVPGSFWGKGVPQLMKPIQDIINATVRAMSNNEGIASGPQIIINDHKRVHPSTDIVNLHPWKVWLGRNPQHEQGAKFVDFFQPDSNAAELMGIMETFIKMADDFSGIPAYSYGSDQVAGAGRALADYETVMTPDGPIPMGRLEIGDLVANSYGGFSRVEGIYPQGERDIYRMTFSNGERVDCDLEHRWSVSRNVTKPKPFFKTYTLREILEKGLFHRVKKDKHHAEDRDLPKWAVPKPQAIDFPERELKIDPYTMGALIGDGDAAARLASADPEIFERIPYELGMVETLRNNRAVRRTVKGIRSEYRSYGLACKSIHKFIPFDYLHTSMGDRLELLRGLMDTDGCCEGQKGQTFFDTSSERLRDDFMYLVKSLGATGVSVFTYAAAAGNVHGQELWGKQKYRVFFDLGDTPVFHLQRKLRNRAKRKRKQRRNTYITGVEYVGRCKATCITVDAKNSLFLCGNFIPTHNTASGLSMLMNSAARGIRKVIASIDQEVIKPIIERQYDWNMQYLDDESLKGDVEVKTVGVLAMIVKEQMMVRRTELLNATNNPLDAVITGAEGRANVLRQWAKQLEMEPDEVVPWTPEQLKLLDQVMMKQRLAMAAAATQPETPPAQGAQAPSSRPEAA
jgi:hypothetical protein